MAVTLIVNPGSSSKKYALYEDGTRTFAAHVEHDEEGYTLCLLVNGVAEPCQSLNRDQFETSLLGFLERAVVHTALKTVTDINTVAVRVVAPGTYFTQHRVVTDEYMNRLQASALKAPLHIPHVLRELTLLRRALPGVQIVAVSDSAFHAGMPTVARTFSLPEEVCAEYDLYHFGYHGLSLQAVVSTLGKKGMLPERLIVCHIGSGVSVTAIKNGVSFDTTMGYAPGSGLIMGSRAGDLDTGALLALMDARHLKPLDATMYIQKNGGLKGLTGESDLRSLLNKSKANDQEAEAALQKYVYGIKKAIGSYIAVLGGLDMLVFTATAGERSPALRGLVCEGLSGLSIVLDQEKNSAIISREGEIQSTASGVTILVLPTDEAQQIYEVATTFVGAE